MKNFINDENGGGTIMGLLWFMILVAICGLAVDGTDAFRNQTMSQATADSAALASVIDVTKGRAEVVSAAFEYTEKNMASSYFGNMLTPDGIDLGKWDHVNKIFNESASNPDAVRVFLNQTGENGNPVYANFLRITGWEFFDVKTIAIAQRFLPDCIREGLVARGVVDLESRNEFKEYICIHGQQGVDMQNLNKFDLGVNVSAPPGIALNENRKNLYDKNDGLEVAERENILDPWIVDHVSEIMDNMLIPGHADIPEYIEASTVTEVDDKFDFTEAQAGEIYYVKCAANKLVQIPEMELTEVVIISDCNINIAGGAYLHDVVIGSRGGNGRVESSNINIPADAQLGRPDGCKDGGGVTLLSNSSVHMTSMVGIEGLQLIAAGDVDLGANADGVNGVSVQAGGDINLTANNVFGLCPGVPTLGAVWYYRLVY